jgi:hypothetical protein
MRHELRVQKRVFMPNDEVDVILEPLPLVISDLEVKLLLDDGWQNMGAEERRLG